jgi:hypothetical protein
MVNGINIYQLFAKGSTINTGLLQILTTPLATFF